MKKCMGGEGLACAICKSCSHRQSPQAAPQVCPLLTTKHPAPTPLLPQAINKHHEECVHHPNQPK